jgi:hypothetical protein
VASLAAGTPDAIAIRFCPLDTKHEPGRWTVW